MENFFFHYWVILNVYMGSFLIILSLYLYLLPIELLLYIICRKGHLGFKPVFRIESSMNKIMEKWKRTLRLTSTFKHFFSEYNTDIRVLKLKYSSYKQLKSGRFRTKVYFYNHTNTKCSLTLKMCHNPKLRKELHI